MSESTLSSLTWTLQEKAKAAGTIKGSQLAHLEWHLAMGRVGGEGSEPELLSQGSYVSSVISYASVTPWHGCS